MTTGSLDSQAMAILSQALEQPSPERDAWVRTACGDNSALYDRVMSLLAADRDHAEVLRTGGAGKESTPPPPPERVGAYQITGLIGQGGMGAVYEGKRITDNFDHRVAIKIVRPGALSEALTERFERERQILAALNHPNIARLFDGGELEDGAPYIVMEFVDGKPITEWAEARDLSMDDRLWLFSDLCGAVRHAHQNLIIHRDITPSNVLVTQEGVVKLIDFGIAKPHAIGATSVPQEGGSLSGLSFTPGYAAPERSKGAAANTLSDVFSLGKILAALADSAPLHADLSAIIDRACASAPDDRYPSVDALQEDVQNLRAGRSVDARGGGALYHVGKFVARRRGAVFAGAFALLLLVGSLVAMTYLYSQAEADRRVADKRFAEAREMANFMLFDLYDQLQVVPGNTEALQKMADHTRRYLDDLSQSSRSNSSLELETIKGYHRLGNIEGNPIGSNLGRRDKSLEMLELAHQRLATLAEREPSSPEILRELGTLNYSRSVYAYIAEDNNEKSIAFAEDGVRYMDELIASGEATLSDQIMRFDILQYTAKPYIWMEESGKAVELYRQIEQQLLEFETAHPDNEEVEYTIATFYTSYTEVANWHHYFTEESREEMLRTAGESIRRIDRLNNVPDPKVTHRRSRAIAYYRRGSLFGELEMYDDSIPDLTTARTATERLVQEDPRNEGNQGLLSAIESQLMLDLSATGKHDEAIALGEAFLSEVEASYLAEPGNPGYHRDYFQKLHMVGEIHIAARQYDRGCDYFLKSAASAKSFDEDIGLSEGDRDHMYNDLLQQEAACIAGSIADLELEE